MPEPEGDTLLRRMREDDLFRHQAHAQPSDNVLIGGAGLLTGMGHTSALDALNTVFRLAA